MHKNASFSLKRIKPLLGRGHSNLPCPTPVERGHPLPIPSPIGFRHPVKKSFKNPVFMSFHFLLLVHNLPLYEGKADMV